jgi:hypothetical protein
MTEANSGTTRGYKTIGVRLDDAVHSQMVLIAGLNGQSLTEAIQQAIEAYIQQQRSEATFAERAAEALTEIEREATARRAAIQSLFGQDAPAEAGPATEEEAAKTPRGRRGREATS